MRAMPLGAIMEYTKTDYGYTLNPGIISDEEYYKIKPIVEHLGGHWREKFHCFVFPNDVSSYIFDAIKNGVEITDEYRWREEHQFYPTPKHIAQRVVELADIKLGVSVLEPSAGTGSLVDEITVPCDILCIEPMSNNIEILRTKGYKCLPQTFETFVPDKKYQRIIMNPPFSGQRDILHFLRAWDMLAPGGIIVGIISENALYYQTEISKQFNKFLEENNAYIEPVPARSFEDYGTSIETVMIKIARKS
jgi:hypothetical protein